MGNLTALAVKNAKPGDKLSDGDGLRLDVDKNGNRSTRLAAERHDQVANQGAEPGARKHERQNAQSNDDQPRDSIHERHEHQQNPRAYFPVLSNFHKAAPT